MTNELTLTRRDFVKVGGALFVGANLPLAFGASTAEAATTTLDATELKSWLEIHADGTILARTGKTETGTSASAFYAQVIAEELNVDWSKLGSIRLMSRNHRHSNWKSNSSQNARSLRTEYRLISRLALSNRSGGIDGRPPVRYMASKVGDNSTRARSAKRLMTRNGW